MTDRHCPAGSADIHVAQWRICLWMVLISRRCSVRRLASIASLACSMQRPASTAPLSATRLTTSTKTGEDAHRLTMAVAGFSPSELDITVQENTLLVTGKTQKEEEKK